MTEEMLELAEADDVKVRITKREDGFVVTLTGNNDVLLFQLLQIRGSVTVLDERKAISPPSPPRARPRAQRRAPVTQPDDSGGLNN